MNADPDDALVTLADPAGDETAPAAPPVHTRLPGESSVAHAAFRAWLDLGPTRGLPEVAHGLSKSLGLIKRWSARWRWQARLRSWETEQEETRCHAEEAAALERARRWEDRREQAAELQHAAALEMVERGRKLLASLDEFSASPGAVARLLTAGVEMLRLSVNLPAKAEPAQAEEPALLVPAGAAQPVVNIILEGNVPVDPLPPPWQIEPESDGA